MNIDDIARAAGLDAQKAAKSTVRPEIARLLRQRQRRSSAYFASTAVVVLGFGLAFLLPQDAEPSPAGGELTTTTDTQVATTTGSTTTTQPETSTSLDGSAIEPPSHQSSLNLDRSVQGNRTTVNVTFTDGKTFDLVYPTEWGLADHSWVPQTDLILELEEPRQNGLGYLWASATFTYSTANGWIPSITYRPEWTDEEKSFAEEAMVLTQQDNGFVALQTTPPLRHSSTDPDQGPTIADLRSPAILNIGGLVELHDECDPTSETVTTDSYVSWCDADARVAVVVFTAPQYHDEVIAALDVISASDE